MRMPASRCDASVERLADLADDDQIVGRAVEAVRTSRPTAAANVGRDRESVHERRPILASAATIAVVVVGWVSAAATCLRKNNVFFNRLAQNNPLRPEWPGGSRCSTKEAYGRSAIGSLAGKLLMGAVGKCRLCSAPKDRPALMWRLLSFTRGGGAGRGRERERCWRCRSRARRATACRVHRALRAGAARLVVTRAPRSARPRLHVADGLAACAGRRRGCDLGWSPMPKIDRAVDAKPPAPAAAAIEW